ncbi:partial Cell division protein FtsZ, partial [uncultured bacterium]
MTNFITLDQEKKVPAVLRVVGVGGAGCNAINSMIDRGLTGVEFIAVNTDIQDLEKVKATVKLQIGSNLTRGLGAGANSEVGKKAAEEDRDKISDVLRDSDMVFITAGMGGGTGTGAAPVVASIAKNLGALVVGVVTLPFRFEGRQKQLIAEKGVQELRQHVDSLIMIPNEKLMAILDKKISMQQAFDKPNEVLFEATRGIADLITETGLFNVDFADVKTVMAGSGMALMGC